MRRLLVLAAGVLLLAAPAARAATINVTTTTDAVGNDGQCSLREAISSANADAAPFPGSPGECATGGGADTVALGIGSYTRLLAGFDNTNVAGDLDVSSVVTLLGMGAALTTIDASGKDRVIDVQPGAGLTIEGVTIVGGVAPNGANNATTNTGTPGGPSSIGGPAGNGPGGPGEDGGGIRSAGSLTILDSTVSQNHAGNGGTGGSAAGGFGGGGPNGGYGGSGTGGAGGAGGSGGGIFANGTLTLTRVVVTGNFAGNGGTGGTGSGGSGGFANSSSGQGGVGGNGLGGAAGAGGNGGGIATGAGKVTLDQSSVRANFAGTGGHGGLGQGGQGGTAVASGASGGLGGDGNGGVGGAGGRGGGIRAAPTSPSSIERSLIDGNIAGAGGTGGTGTGGKGGEGAVTGSTGGGGGSGNAGTGGGGGRGAAVDSLAVTYANDTIAANTTGAGGVGGAGNGGLSGPTAGGGGGPVGGGYGGNGGDAGAGALATAGTTAIVHATITANIFGSAGGGGTGAGGGGSTNGTGGGGGSGAAILSGASTALQDSVLAANGTPACQGTVTNGGGNISFGDASCPGTNLDPMLGALADNGGPTLTRKPQPGSPAIDLVPTAGAGCAATDQRLVLRPFGVGCDAGAYELAPPSLVVAAATGISLDSATLQGTVNPNARASSYHFEYGPTTDYGSSTPQQDLPAGVDPVAVSAAIAGLTPGTTYHVRLAGTNADGASASADATFTTTTQGGDGGGGGGDKEPPLFQSASMKPKTFAVNRKGTAEKLVTAKVRRGTTFRYRLSEAARVVFTIQRRKGKRFVQARRFAKASKAGANTKKFSGRIGKRALKPGRYRATLVATDAAGNRSRAKRLTFKVLR